MFDQLPDDSQLRETQEKIQALKHNLTKDDLNKAPYSRVTVKKYMDGMGARLDVAVELLRHFKSCIRKRQAEIREQI